jgi:hypothetical protein
MIQRYIKLMALLLVAIAAAGCATKPAMDYSAYKESRPKSILVLPPVNNTPEIPASYSVLSYVSYPLAEAGYYVMPVTLVAEAFKENGMTQPNEMHATSLAKLSEIFGADAALYITISKYGTVYSVISSDTVVAAQAKLVDLKTGKTLWTGSAQAAKSESDSGSQSSLVGLLVKAIVNQIIATATDESHRVAGVATFRLLTPQKNGLLYGPRSPNYQRD